MPGQRFHGEPVSGPDRPTDNWQTPNTSAPVAVQRYRSHAPLIAILAAVVVAALVTAGVWAGTRPSATTPTPGVTPSTSAPLPTCDTPSPGWQAIPYEVNATTTGCWAVSAGEWAGDTVTINTTVASDQGTIGLTFFALDNNDSNYEYDPTGGTMAVTRVTSGKSVSGTLIFEIPRGDFTLYMLKNPSTIQDLPIAALVVKG